MKKAEILALVEEALKGRRVLGYAAVVDIIDLKPRRGDKTRRHRAGAMTFTLKLSAKARR
jgi:hypothetical protein